MGLKSLFCKSTVSWSNIHKLKLTRFTLKKIRNYALIVEIYKIIKVKLL